MTIFIRLSFSSDATLAKFLGGRYDLRMSQTANSKKVLFLLYEGVQLLDVSGPAEVLTQANLESGEEHYDIHYVSNHAKGWVTSSAGLKLHSEPLPTARTHFHTLIIPGANIDELQVASQDKSLLGWIGKMAKKSKRVVSICTGAFLLAETGLLDGLKVTTHWFGIDELQKRFPETKVIADTLYVEEQGIWTSAGVLSGVDMTLAIVSRDVGPEVALRIARNLIVYLVRDGGQSQFSGPLNLQLKTEGSDLVKLVSWLEQNLSIPLSIDNMAEHMAMSTRTLHRQCQQVFAMTPARLFSELRLEQARNKLHNPNTTIKVVALDCGFSNSSAFSKAFRKRYGISPQGYRVNFSQK
jgi:transcriptional regulator GlxA family with amidase domain